MAHAHLNGSVNLENAEEVFRTVSAICGETVTRIPDGQADAATALASYEIFRRLRDEEHAILPGTRFQVSLGAATDWSDLQSILGGIQHEDLSVQWDAPIETLDAEELTARSRSVSGDVPFGYHLCGHGAGDIDDMGALVAAANRITQCSHAPPAWFSLPVPCERDDSAYFAPLAGLRLAAGTHPYLGLVHEDGLSPTQARIAAAKPYLRRFGVAAECGMGDKPRETVLKLLWLQLGAVV